MTAADYVREILRERRRIIEALAAMVRGKV